MEKVESENTTIVIGLSYLYAISARLPLFPFTKTNPSTASFHGRLSCRSGSCSGRAQLVLDRAEEEGKRLLAYDWQLGDQQVRMLQ